MRGFLFKLSVLLAISWCASMLPSPVRSLSFEMKNGAVLIAAVLYTGKLLYDTLFFDHYLP
jgi:hypothetical protein